MLYDLAEASIYFILFLPQLKSEDSRYIYIYIYHLATENIMIIDPIYDHNDTTKSTNA